MSRAWLLVMKDYFKQSLNNVKLLNLSFYLIIKQKKIKMISNETCVWRSCMKFLSISLLKVSIISSLADPALLMVPTPKKGKTIVSTNFNNTGSSLLGYGENSSWGFATLPTKHLHFMKIESARGNHKLVVVKLVFGTVRLWLAKHNSFSFRGYF